LRNTKNYFRLIPERICVLKLFTLLSNRNQGYPVLTLLKHHSSALCYGMQQVRNNRFTASESLVTIYVKENWNNGLCSTQTQLCGFCSKANNTDRATASCRWSQCKLLRIENVAWSAQRITTAVNLDILDAEPLFFHSSSSSVKLASLSGPRSRSTTSEKIW
jgi:hypothetical protein